VTSGATGETFNAEDSVVLIIGFGRRQKALRR